MVVTSSNILKLVHSSTQAPAAPAPSLQSDGILALLVTDLEGFTALLEQLGDLAAQRVIQEHNATLRACIRRWRGQEVAHTGDGIIAAFRSAVAAVGCALDLQQKLLEQSRTRRVHLRARAGIHVGEPLPEEGRLFGQCINTAVRICAQAQPGSVLVSDVVEQLTRGRFAFGPGALHQLKGLSRPMMLHDCGAR